MKHDPETVRRLLERDLIDRSEQPELRLIWADLLQLEGDPLGKLIVLDHVAASDPGPVAERARSEAEALRRQLQPRLWDRVIPDEPGVSLTWRLGFVRELHVQVDQLRWPKRSAIAIIDRLITDLLRQPALRWIEVVRVEVDDALARDWSRWLFGGRLHNPILREIHVGRPPEARTRPSGAWERGGGTVGASTIDHAAIQGLRQLRLLSIGGERIRLPCRDGNTQTRLHHVVSLATRPLTLENRVSLARALWDGSETVHRAAFECARTLGLRAAFLLDELAWFLRPPLSPKDPRPLATLLILTAIGPASAALLGEVLARPEELLDPRRIMAFMSWLIALGPAAASARALLDSLLNGRDWVVLPATRKAITQARRAIESP